MALEQNDHERASTFIFIPLFLETEHEYCIRNFSQNAQQTRKKEKERQRDRETERQRDRETERQRERETERKRLKIELENLIIS